MQTLSKLIDYFLVVGIDEQLKLCNFDEREEDKYVTDLQLYVGDITKQRELESNENVKWLDLDGYQTLWLKVSYNHISTPITSISFLAIPFEDKQLKMEECSQDIIPIRIQLLNSQQNSENQMSLFVTDYDLTGILGFERVPGNAIVLCSKKLDPKIYQSPIVDLDVLNGERRRDVGGIVKDFPLLKPSFELVERTFVNKEKTFKCLVFQRADDFLSRTFVPSVSDRYPQEVAPETEAILANIQMFCFPEGISLSRQIREPNSFSFILTKESGERVYGTALVFDEDFPEDLQDKLGYGPINQENPLFTQKAICILSDFPFLSEFKEILKQIYRLHLSRNLVPLERIICNLVDETPLPMKGKLGVLVDYGQQILFQRALNHPIVPEKSIKNLFRVLSLPKIVELVKMVLLEKKILLISKYKSLLTDVAEAITGFICPFIWVRPLIPILPLAWKDYLECPTPFLIGLNVKNQREEDFFIPDDVIRVYLDKGEIHHEERIPVFSEKATKALFKRLELFESYHQKHRGKDFNYDSAFGMQVYQSEEEHADLNAYEVQDAFFELMGSLLKHYHKFFLQPPEGKKELVDLKEIFDVGEFLKRKKAVKEGAILNKIINETSFFSNFIQARTSSNHTDIDYQWIDICLKKKRSKKEARFIQRPEVETTFPKYPPNSEKLESHSTYVYKRFPRFNQNLFIESRMVTNQTGLEKKSSRSSLNIEGQKLSLVDQKEWAKLLLESIYTIWFVVFNIKLKHDYKDYFPKLTEFAILLLEDAQNKGVKLNEVMYRNLLEALYFCDMNEKVTQIANQLKQSQNNISSFAYGIRSDISSEIKKFKNQRKTPLSTQSQSSPTLNKSSQEKLGKINRCVRILADEVCHDCGKKLSEDEIISGWKKSFHEYTTRCSKCGKNFVASLKILEHCEDRTKETSVHFFSPLIVKKEIENLVRIKGPQVLTSEKFEHDHKILFWNLYFYFDLIKAPTFLLQNDFEQEQVLNNIKLLEEQIQNSQEKKSNWSISFFGNPFKPKSTALKEDNSNLANDKQQTSKINESTKVSFNESVRGSLIGDASETNSAIKKIFWPLFIDLKKEYDRRIEEFDFGIKEKKEGVSPGTFVSADDVTEDRKSEESIRVE